MHLNCYLDWIDKDTDERNKKNKEKFFLSALFRSSQNSGKFSTVFVKVIKDIKIILLSSIDEILEQVGHIINHTS